MLRDIWILSDRHGGLKEAHVILLPSTITGWKKKKTRWAEWGTLGQARFNELLLVSEISSLDEAEVSYFLNMFSPVYSMSTKIRQGGRWKVQDSEQTRYLDVNIKPILFCISKVQDLTIIALKTALAHCRLPLFSAHFQQQSHHEEGCSKISHL